MNKHTLFACTAAAVTLPIGLVAAYLASAAPHAAAPAARAALPGPPLPPSPGAPAVVDAANAFLSTLTPPQLQVAQIELTPQNAARRSNFPAGFVPRKAFTSGT